MRYYINRMCQIDGIHFDAPCFVEHFSPDWNTGQRLAEIMEALEKRGATAHAETPPLVRWDVKGPVDEQLANEPAWWCRFTGPDGRQVSQ